MKTMRRGAKLELKTVHDRQPQFNSDIKLSIESNPIIRSDLTSNGMEVNWAEFKVKILKVANPRSPISVGQREYSVNTLVASQVMQASGTPKELVRLNNYDVEDVKISAIPSLEEMALKSTLK